MSAVLKYQAGDKGMIPRQIIGDGLHVAGLFEVYPAVMYQEVHLLFQFHQSPRESVISRDMIDLLNLTTATESLPTMTIDLSLQQPSQNRKFYSIPLTLNMQLFLLVT